MPTKTILELPLVLKDRIILSEGRWNGVYYPADELEPLVPSLNNIPKLIQEAERRKDEEEALRLRNATSLFWDHDEKCENWLGDVKNFRWDRKEKAIRADLYLLDEDAARKIQYQERRKFSSWGISPSVLVDRIRMTARNIKFLNIGIVLEPAGGVKLMLSAPRIRGEKPMAKKKQNLMDEKEEKENKEELEDDAKKEMDETAAEEKTKEEKFEESTEDLEEIEIDNEEGSEEEDKDKEEMAATLDDVMNAVKAVAKMLGDLIAAMKKTKGYGYYPYKKTQGRELSGLSDLGKEKLTAIAGAIGKAYQKLESEDLELANLCGFLSEVNGLLPVVENLEADDEAEEEPKEEAAEEGTEEKADEKAEKESEAAEEKKEEDAESSKENMSKRLVEDLRAGLKKDIRSIVSEEIGRRVRPRRKGVVEDQVEKLAKERQDLRNKLRDPSTSLEERFDLAARIACGGKK